MSATPQPHILANHVRRLAAQRDTARAQRDALAATLATARVLVDDMGYAARSPLAAPDAVEIIRTRLTALLSDTPDTEKRTT